jgi:tyrosyl-tRNA synthetase
MEIKRFTQYFKINEDVNTKKFMIIPEGSSLPTSGVVKIGFDPTGKDLHLGHLVVLQMVKKLKEAGMDVHVILGTFTAQLGDPSGRDATRPMLGETETKANANAIISQLHRVLGSDITIHYNHEWFNKMTLPEMMQILSKYTVDYLMSRDAFQKRKESGNTIGMHELIVPILQGLDSVELKANVEVGGTDQLFNFMLSREVQSKAGQTPEICVMAPIINGTDGRKMSKSFNNCIYINDDPKNVFGKAMSISDEVMFQWYELFFEGYNKEDHPMKLKKELATEITDMIWGKGSGEKERQSFESINSGALPTDIKEYNYSNDGIVAFISTVAKMSRSDARRLLQQGGVTVSKDGVNLTKIDMSYEPENGDILKIGKRNYAKIVK